MKKSCQCHLNTLITMYAATEDSCDAVITAKRAANKGAFWGLKWVSGESSILMPFLGDRLESKRWHHLFSEQPKHAANTTGFKVFPTQFAVWAFSSTWTKFNTTPFRPHEGAGMVRERLVLSENLGWRLSAVFTTCISRWNVVCAPPGSSDYRWFNMHQINLVCANRMVQL